MQHAKATSIARTLRKRNTWAEKLLWSWLRDRRFSTYKFRRQHTFGPYILDFFCVEAFLDIELARLHNLRLSPAVPSPRGSGPGWGSDLLCNTACFDDSTP